MSARIAVVHEWLLDYAGSERVLREILEVVPAADLFVLVDRPDQELAAAIPRRARATSFLQHLPRPHKWLRYYLPLMPIAVRGLDVSRYDIVVSSSHAVAKGVASGKNQFHLSYVHTPMRYAWDMREEYLRAAGWDRGLRGWAARHALERLRRWDARSAGRVDRLLANSLHVAERIRRSYGRDAEVLYPPVDTEVFTPGGRKTDFFLTVSRLEPYKRVDLVLEAFARMPERRLVVIGDGPEMRRLRAMAPPNARLVGRLSTGEVRDHMRAARAFVFAGVEDFGIVMAEAQACGTPLIALGRGGAAEIAHPETGVLFGEQNVAALLGAMRHFDEKNFTPEACRGNALRFGRANFRQRFDELLRSAYNEFKSKNDDQ